MTIDKPGRYALRVERQADSLWIVGLDPKRKQPALALVEDLNRQRPNDARLQKSMVVTLSNMKRYDEAIAQAHQYIVRHGEDLTIIDVLKVAHFYTGMIDDAVDIGVARKRQHRLDA